jgi:hypothetical protein
MDVAAAVKNGRNPQRFRSSEFSRETPSGDRKVRQNATPSGPLGVETTKLSDCRRKRPVGCNNR